MSHYKLIKSLITEIKKLRADNLHICDLLDSAHEQHANYEYRMEKRNNQLREQYNRSEQQRRLEQQETQSKEWEREDLVKKLERQQHSGDDWGAERTMRQLKNL